MLKFFLEGIIEIAKIEKNLAMLSEGVLKTIIVLIYDAVNKGEM